MFKIGGVLSVKSARVWRNAPGLAKERDEARKVLRRVVEQGVNLIDTADAYGPSGSLGSRVIGVASKPFNISI